MEEDEKDEKTTTIENDRDFSPSSLGTKIYWDDAYNRELRNFRDIGDVGEIWFGEDSEERVVDWIDECPDIKKSDAIIDLGCGNGMLLINLRRHGFSDLTGVDYSETGIQLACDIVDKENINHIRFETADLVSDITGGCVECLCRKYHVCVDKGTYDAISLMPTESSESRQAYKQNILNLLKKDGYFVITSCNWTKEELLAFFGTDFSLHDEIKAPTFQFGGKTGRTVTSLIFRLKP